MYRRPQLIRQRAISNHYKRSRSMLDSLRHTDPRFGSNLEACCFGKLGSTDVLLGRWKTEN